MSDYDKLPAIFKAVVLPETIQLKLSERRIANIEKRAAKKIAKIQRRP